MGVAHVGIYDGERAPYLVFGEGVPRLVILFQDGRCCIDFPDEKAMELFRRNALCLLEDSQKYMHLRLQMEHIAREKGGESE